MVTTAEPLRFSPSKKNGSEDGALQVHVFETSHVVIGQRTVDTGKNLRQLDWARGDENVCVHEISRVVRAVGTGSGKLSVNLIATVRNW